MLGGRTGNQVDHRYLGEEMSTRRLRLPANSNSDPDNNECEKDLHGRRLRMLARPLSLEWILTPLNDGPVVLVALAVGGHSLNLNCTWGQISSFPTSLAGAGSGCLFSKTSHTLISRGIGCVKTKR